jgi:hypothetical protein
MNDGYGKLVSRFPHQPLTMAPIVLTPRLHSPELTNPALMSLTDLQLERGTL